MDEELEKRRGHQIEFDEDCPVCVSEFRKQIERLYFECRPLTEIVDLLDGDIDVNDIKRHAKALGLDAKRADNTDAIRRHALNSSFDRGVLDDLDADQTLELLKHTDRVLGKVRDREVDRLPPMVMFVGVPMIGGVVPGEQAESLLAKAVEVVDPVLPTLPPGISAKKEEKSNE